MYRNEAESRFHKIMYIGAVVITYWAVSISMVYLNKILMSNDVISIPAPLFITWVQCAITTILCWIAGVLGERNLCGNELGSYQKLNGAELGEQMKLPQRPAFFSQFPRVTYSTQTAVKIFPLSLIFTGMVTGNNICLKYVEVSYYNVARSLTIIFNVFFSWLVLGVPTNSKTAACLLVVITGFFIGTWGEINFSMIGTASGIISSVFVSLNSIFTKKMLPLVDDSHWKLTLYNNANAVLIMAPLVYAYEGDYIMEHFLLFKSPMYWSLLTISGFFGFSIGIVTVLQIQATSPLTHNFSGTAKAGVQSMLAFYLWGNEATVEGVFGICMVLGGSLLYTFVRMNQNNQVKPIPDLEMQRDPDVTPLLTSHRQGNNQDKNHQRT